MAAIPRAGGRERCGSVKILLCHNFYQPSGGEDAAVLALKALLEDKGHRVSFFTEDNREINDYGALQKMAFVPRTLYSVKTYRRVRRIAVQEKPDVAHVHNVFPLLSPALYVVLQRARIPIVQTVHNYRMMCLNGLFLRDGSPCERCAGGQFFSGVRFRCYRESFPLSALYALAIGGHRRWGTFRHIDHFIALTSFAADKMVENGIAQASKISVLGNFLPTTLPEPGEPNLSDPYIAYLGRLSHEKGLFTLLEALRGKRDLRLKVMGTGPLGEALKNYIRQHRLENVEMLGFVEGDEKYGILRGALCCVVPSECYENFPLAVLESAAVGTPVVASRIGGLAAIIADGQTGFFFPPGDSAGLRSRLDMLSVDPGTAIRVGREARRSLLANYTREAHYDGVMKIYRELAGRAATASSQG
jgi:glycosyltransferase involved in cell wall biosynthesis